jgi:hypothetical protein
MLTAERFGRSPRNPLDSDRARGHRIVGPCEQGRPRERHYFALAAVIVAVIAAGVSAYASYEQGQTAKATSKFNQKMAQRQAEQRRLEAEAAAKRKAKENERIMAAQRARIGGAGVLSTEGTPLLVQMESAEQAALDEANIRYAGIVASGDLEGESILQGYLGTRAGWAGNYQAGASLLQGASSATSAYANYRRGTA